MLQPELLKQLETLNVDDQQLVLEFIHDLKTQRSFDVGSWLNRAAALRERTRQPAGQNISAVDLVNEARAERLNTILGHH